MEKEIIKNKQNNNDIQEKIDFEPDLKKQLFQLRTFLDNNDWINFFLDLQKIITEPSGFSFHLFGIFFCFLSLYYFWIFFLPLKYPRKVYIFKTKNV